MSIINALITDRTQKDVDRQLYLNNLYDPFTKQFSGTLEEAEEWLAGTKGTYGAKDLNRVGEAILYVSDRMNAAGYAVEVSPRTDFTDADWVTPGYAKKLLRELQTIRRQFLLTAGAPDVPTDMELLNFKEANDIELILQITDRLLSNIMAAWYFSGDIYSGEV